MASTDPVEEEMGDILSAFGIPDLAKHIIPIPLPPLDVDDEETPGGSRGDPEGEDPEKDHPKKEKEKVGAEGGDTSKDRDEDEGDDDQDEGTKAQEAEEITDDKENLEEDMAMETDEGTDSITDVSQNEDEAPSQDRKIETSIKQPQKAVPDLGLKQSVASLHEDETGAQKTSLIKELLKSTSKPVMTSRLQGALQPPDTSLDVPEEPDMEGNPESLTSVDEFNSFLDRYKEGRELKAMKLAMLGKPNSVATYQCPDLTKEQMKVLDMDNTTFQCPGCNDTYLFKASLDAHLNRRTVLVTFRCKFCTGRKNLVFYNKCTFLAHLHYHNAPESDIENIKSQASISPVNALACLKAYTMLTAPEKKKVTANKSSVASHAALKNPSTPSITHSTTTSKQSDTPPSAVKTQVINKPRAVVLHPKNTNQLQLVQKDGQTSYLCMGCNVRYEKMIHLSSHLGRSDHVPKAKYGHKACLHQCNVCKLLLGNTCKLKMHSIIHNDQTKPMPCPECGCLFTDLKSLLIHQNDGCLHWMTRPLFKCFFCNKYATTFPGLVKHLEQCHVESFFKCPLCQLAFRTKQSANEHSLQIHKLSNASYSLLRKCPFCKSVYSEGGMLLNHFDGHFKEGLIKIEKFVYTCPLCNRPFDYNLALLNHLKNEHGRSSTNMFTCDLCLSPFSSVTNLMIHRQSCHIKPNKELRNSEPEKKNPGQSAENTIVCGECGEKLPKFDMNALRKHMFEKHGGQVKDSLAMQKNKEVTTIDKVQEDAIRPKGSGESAKDSSVTKAEATKVTVSRFTDQQCAKCQFKSKDRLVFEKHIRGHKADDSLNQCHECGLCFTVSMSLKKHLFIKHKIKNMDLYNTTYDDLIPRWEDDMKKKKLEEEKERESTKSDMKEEDDGKAHPAFEEKGNAEEEEVEESSLFKCKVCKVEFENEKALTVHARSHGLAYLQHTLSRSPEKAARMLNSKPAESSPQSPEVVEKPKTSPVVKRMLPSDTDSSTSSDEGSSIEDQNGN